MPRSDHKIEPPDCDKKVVNNEQMRPDEPLDDEEKVVAGLPDVNMTALLTRDVPGG